VVMAEADIFEIVGQPSLFSLTHWINCRTRNDPMRPSLNLQPDCPPNQKKMSPTARSGLIGFPKNRKNLFIYHRSFLLTILQSGQLV
jgi:hypothetical protein